MIREATKQDIPVLVDMGRQYHLELCAFATIKNIEFCEKSIATMLGTLIEGENSVVFVDNTLTGVIGGMIYPFWINTAYLSGNEVFWWVDKNERGGLGVKLWTKLESWAKDKGAAVFQMMALENVELSRIERIYKHRGYEPIEHVFMKVF